jgi:hypothetical protein
MAATSSRFTMGRFVVALIVFLLVVGLLAFHLLASFAGLTNARGIDQAQVARNVAEGKGWVTSSILPAMVQQVEQQGVVADFRAFPDTYHPPLPVFLQAAVWRAARPADADPVKGDRLIAATSMVLFLVGTIFVFLLVAGLFDSKLAVYTSFILLFSDLFWGFSKSGLPHMLVFVLFVGLLLCLFQAWKAYSRDEPGLRWMLLAGGVTGLLLLSHGMAFFVLPGLLIYVGFFLSRGRANALLVGITALVIVSPWYIRNMQLTGSPMGAARLLLTAGFAGQTEEQIMANLDADSQGGQVTSLVRRTLYTTIYQLDYLYTMLGMGPMALVFFLALLHPFRRGEIASLRWAILLMWLGVVIGSSVIGLPDNQTDARQIHLVFGPVMAAYGLAFVTICWSRLKVGQVGGVLSHAPLLAMAGLSLLQPATYMLQTVSMALAQGSEVNALDPRRVISEIRDVSMPDDLVLSDDSSRVAWYSGRTALLLPYDLGQLKVLLEKAAPLKASGVLFTAATTNQPFTQVASLPPTKEWFALGAQLALQRVPRAVLDEKNFPFLVPVPRVFRGDLIYLTSPERYRLIQQAAEAAAAMDQP